MARKSKYVAGWVAKLSARVQRPDHDRSCVQDALSSIRRLVATSPRHRGELLLSRAVRIVKWWAISPPVLLVVWLLIELLLYLVADDSDTALNVATRLSVLTYLAVAMSLHLIPTAIAVLRKMPERGADRVGQPAARLDRDRGDRAGMASMQVQQPPVTVMRPEDRA